MKTGKKKQKKQKYMSDELFGELMLSLDQALQYSHGGQVNARTTVLPAKPMSQQEIIPESDPCCGAKLIDTYNQNSFDFNGRL